MHDQQLLDRPPARDDDSPGFFDCRGEWQSLQGMDR